MWKASITLPEKPLAEPSQNELYEQLVSGPVEPGVQIKVAKASKSDTNSTCNNNISVKNNTQKDERVLVVKTLEEEYE